MLAIPAWKPLLGFALGLLGAGTSLGYLIVPKVRPTMDRIFLIVGDSGVRRFGLAIAGLLWATTMIMGSVGMGLSAKEEEAKAQKAKEVVAANKEANLAAQNELLAAAQKELELGDLDGATRDLTSASAYGVTTELSALHERLATASRERELERLPALLASIQAHDGAQEWESAIGDCVVARTIDGDFAGLGLACDIAAEGQRVASIPKWIEAALAVAADEVRCDTPVDIADAWTNLRQVLPTDAGYKKAQSAATKLEKCRKKSERAFSKGLRDIMISQREQWAKTYEALLLDQGFDVDVRLSGTHKEKVKIEWILLSKPAVHQITKDGTFLAELEKIGFVKVTFSDGYYESWYYELEPLSESDGGKKVLEQFGLDKPLSL